MAEAAVELENEAPSAPDPALQEALRKLDRANMKKIGAYHFTMVMGAYTLWGAAEAWFQTTGWLVAGFAAIANAVICAYVVSAVLHEWGHFAGARLRGAVSPVLDEPKNHFFMFDFKMDQNDVDQFVWMSWGGILVPWLLVLDTLFFVPIATTSGAVLLATFVARAVGVSMFEVPIVRDAAESGDPRGALGRGLPNLDRGRRVGYAVGAGVFLFLWLLV